MVQNLFMPFYENRILLPRWCEGKYEHCGMFEGKNQSITNTLIHKTIKRYLQPFGEDNCFFSLYYTCSINYS